MNNFLLAIISVVGMVFALHAQEPRGATNGYTYDILQDRIDEPQAKPAEAKKYAGIYLQKAKAERNTREIVTGYKYLLHLSDPALRLSYADSMVAVALKTKDAAVIGSAYLTRGIVYYDRKKHTLALDNYVLANKHIAAANDPYLVHKIKFNIAQIKNFLGFYDEAIALLEECVSFYESEGGRPYLSSLHSLGLSYNRTGDFDQCARINELGKRSASAVEDQVMTAYFRHSDGVNRYFLGDYRESVADLLSCLPLLIKREDFANETVAHFYIGRSYWAMGKIEQALTHFRKVDARLDENYTRPDFRVMYELLIRHYKNDGDAALRLYYIDRLYKTDSLISKTHHHLSRQIRKGLDTAELAHYRSDAKSQLDRKNRQLLFVILAFIVLLAIVISLLVWRRSNKHRYRQKFEELMNRPPEVRPKPQAVKNEQFILSVKNVEIILNKLEDLKNSDQYLRPDINLNVLVSIFGVNSRYIGMVIKRYYNRNTTEYLNDLKVNHVIKLLTTEKKYRNYTQKSLADAVGLGSTSRLNRAFESTTGMTLAIFLENIRMKNDPEPGDEPGNR